MSATPITDLARRLYELKDERIVQLETELATATELLKEITDSLKGLKHTPLDWQDRVDAFLITQTRTAPKG